MPKLNLWKYLSNFWDSFKDKGLFDAVWDSFHDVTDDLRNYLFQANLNKGIAHLSPSLSFSWMSIALTQNNLKEGSSDTYEILEEGTATIPSLQDGIDTPVNIYHLNVDYEIEGIYLKWISSKPVPENVLLWSEKVDIFSYHIRDTFGICVGEEAVDSQEYLNLITGLINSYWQGPDIRHIRNGLNIILGGDYIKSNGIIVSQTDFLMRVNTSKGIVEYSKDSGISWAWNEGDEVSKFDLTTNTVEVMDYIKDPSWWSIYGMNLFSDDNGVVLPGDEFELNHIAKRFIWGIQIEGTLVAGLPASTEKAIANFMSNINPAYTSHHTIVYNSFWGSEGDELPLTDEWDEYPDGIQIERTFELSQSVTFNEVSNLVYSNFEGSNMSYDDYHSQDYPAYNLDNETLVFDDQLTICKE